MHGPAVDVCVSVRVSNCVVLVEKNERRDNYITTAVVNN